MALLPKNRGDRNGKGTESDRRRKRRKTEEDEEEEADSMPPYRDRKTESRTGKQKREKKRKKKGITEEKKEQTGRMEGQKNRRALSTLSDSTHMEKQSDNNQNDNYNTHWPNDSNRNQTHIIWTLNCRANTPQANMGNTSMPGC